MAQLFTHYSVSEIILFIIILAIAIKKLIQFIDWARKRTRQAIVEKDRPLELASIAQKHDEQLQNIQSELTSLKDSITLLIESDIDDIKQSLTKDHHYFCYKLKSIDDYSLDCMERRYSHYKEEGGNSFVQTLMEEVRALPRRIETQNR